VIYIKQDREVTKVVWCSYDEDSRQVNIHPGGSENLLCFAYLFVQEILDTCFPSILGLCKAAVTTIFKRSEKN